MTPGDVVLVRLPQSAGGPPKLRPALVLAGLPGPYQNVLICGISTQLHGLTDAWDELVQESDVDFPASGIRRASAVRLSFLYAADTKEIAGVIGRIDDRRLERLRSRLAARLQS